MSGSSPVSYLLYSSARQLKSAARITNLFLAIVVGALFVNEAAPFANAQNPSTESQPPAFTPSAPTPNDTLRSPEVGSNGHVIFRLYAPNAREVKLQAEGMEATPGITPEQVRKAMAGFPMARGEDGVWTIDFGPIQPGVYRYTFSVNGVQTTDPRNPISSASLNSVKSIYEVPGAEFLAYRRDVPHGAIASVWYDSKAVGGLRRMHIYTPPGYERENQRYPVLYLLHGGGDTDDSWPTVGRAGAILDNLIAAYQAVPMIVVMPAGHVSRDFQLRTGQNTMGHDKFNEDLVENVIRYVDKNYRTIDNRDHRALAGLSMGGLQTLTLSLANSNLFSYIGVFSSGWFPQSREQEEETDLARYKASGKPYKLYWVGAGKFDILRPTAKLLLSCSGNMGSLPQHTKVEAFMPGTTGAIICIVLYHSCSTSLSPSGLRSRFDPVQRYI